MILGGSTLRVDGPGKLSGATRYVDDLKIEGMLHGATVRSKIARGRIKSIRFDPSIDWDEFTIVAADDVKGRNEVYFIEHEQPALAKDVVRHAWEPIVLIAHPSISKVRKAVEKIEVEIEPMPAVDNPLQELSPDLIQFGKDNVFKRIDCIKGEGANLEPIFKQAAHVVEGEYETGAQEHIYLENQGMIAFKDEQGRMVVQGTMQCPYYVVKSLCHLFEREEKDFRVIQTPTGGGFGGKEDYPSVIAIHAALLAEKSGKPVKIVYDRQEDMAATTKRHPSWVRHRTALDENGKLMAMDIEVVLDGGAYVTLSPVVLSRGVIHAAGPYFCPHSRIQGEARLTNKPPNGAFRGFGAPQTLFPVERHMDVIAERIGMDPIELRRRNLLRPGQTTATSQVMKDDVDLVALMEKGLDLADYENKRKRYAEENKTHPYLRKGIGIATFYHGAGFTGSGESYLASEVWVEGKPDGKTEVLVANTDMGQGTTTVLTQIAADALGVPEEEVGVAVPDTSMVPNSGPTVASRTVMVVGKLVEQACEEIKKQLDFTNGKKGKSLTEAIRAWHEAHPGQRLLGRSKYKQPAEIKWDDNTYVGDAYATYAWAAYVADVEVDLRTYGTRVKDFVALQEVGKVINPTLATGQIQGGVVQAIGWAIMEDVLTCEGAMCNNQMTNYIIPASGDLPPIRVFFEEAPPREYGPKGAKGIGELPMDGPAPAIVNAISQALGRQFHKIPLTPERLMEALEKYETESTKELEHGKV